MTAAKNRIRFLSLFTSGALLAAVGFSAMCYVAHGYYRDNSRHLAQYPDGVVFLGQADASGETTYYRVDLLEGTTTKDAPASFVLHRGDEAYPINSITPEVIHVLSGSYKSDAMTLMDSRGCGLRYKIEDDQLVQLILDASKAQPGSTSVGQYTLSLEEGISFTLPISHGDLVRYAEEPVSTEWQLKN